MMAEEFAAKQIRGPLEVVAVYADHPLKIKLDTCLRVKEMITCINSLFNMHIPHLGIPALLFIGNFGDLSPHGIHQLWGTYFDNEMTYDNCRMTDVTLILSAAATVPYAYNEFGWTVTRRASRGLCLVGVINTLTTLINTSGMSWTSVLCFQKSARPSNEGNGICFPQTARSPFLLLWWSLGASGSSWWAFPCHKGNQCWFLEKPTSLLNTKRVACAPIPVISALVSTNSSVGLTLTKYSLSSAFWMSPIRKIIPLTLALPALMLQSPKEDLNSFLPKYGRCHHHRSFLYNKYNVISTHCPYPC